MYKNQLQELAQRSCFNLPSYACIREGPDHAPRFRASVNFNGEVFEGPSYCTTLRQAEHAAAEVALSSLSTRGPSRSLAAKVIDETGVYKNLLQETAHRAGLNLPVYTTVRSGPGHLPVFTCNVDLAGMNFTGEPAKTKKQAEKNAAMAAWSFLKQCNVPSLGSLSQTNRETESIEEQEQVVVSRVLSNFRPKDGNRASRQKDQQQVRRRLMLGYKEINSASSSKTLQQKQWRCLDLLSDSSSVCPSQLCHRQQSCFLTLPPTGSRIFPPHPIFQQSGVHSQESSSTKDNHPSLYSSNRSIPVQVRSRFQDKMQEIPPPLEEHLKDEEEWLSGRSDFREKPIDKEPNCANKSSAFNPNNNCHIPFSMPRTPNLNTQTQLRTGAVRHSSPLSPVAPSIPTMPTIPRVLNSGRFHLHGVAPAVQIRSVIPVCAAPPARHPPNPVTAQRKENSATSSASASPTVTTQTQEEMSATSLRFNRLHI